MMKYAGNDKLTKHAINFVWLIIAATCLGEPCIVNMKLKGILHVPGHNVNDSSSVHVIPSNKMLALLTLHNYYACHLF